MAKKFDKETTQCYEKMGIPERYQPKLIDGTLRNIIQELCKAIEETKSKFELPSDLQVVFYGWDSGSWGFASFTVFKHENSYVAFCICNREGSIMGDTSYTVQKEEGTLPDLVGNQPHFIEVLTDVENEYGATMSQFYDCQDLLKELEKERPT